MSQPELATIILLSGGLGGAISVFSTALALGLRHGIDWDHIAAITDITSATAGVDDLDEGWLIAEPAVMLTDESHHRRHGPHRPDQTHNGHEHVDGPASAVAGVRSGTTAVMVAERPAMATAPGASRARPSLSRTFREQKTALLYGSLYALGHATVVTVLGLLALLAAGILPSWIDPVMERVVGATLVFLALYLFYSVYRFFRGGGAFRIRSRWMLIFAGVQNAWHWMLSHVTKHEHHPTGVKQYGARTSYGIGLIHGIGAETGTQVLIIATAAGAASKAMGVGALLFFVLGLLISNSLITVASTAGFVSARRRQTIYVAAGLLAGVLSLVLGLLFLGALTTVLPDLDKYVSWVGGGSTS